MRDQYAKTRYFLHKLSKVSDDSISIAQKDIRKNDESYWLGVLAEDNKRLDELDEQDKNCSREVWPAIIQELLDSVDYQRDLQQAYDSWMSLLGRDGTVTFTDEQLKKLESHARCSQEIYEECRQILLRVRSKAGYLFWRIQELKLEYDLHDADYYYLDSLFRSLKDAEGSAYVYVNGPEKDGLSMWSLPITLATERAIVVFGKALNKKWMEIGTDGKLKWVGFDDKAPGAKLGYLLGRIYGYRYSPTENTGNTFPRKELEEYFEIKRLYDSMRQAWEAKKPQPWREVIDELFFEE